MEHGFRRLLVVNGHGGNSALAREAVQQLANRAPVLAASVDYWALARETAAEVRDSPPGGMAHACEFETSLMLHLRPESVRRELVRREIPEPRFSQERLELASPGPVAAGWRTDWLSSSGVLGAPDLASAEKGERLFEACVEGLTALIAELREAPLPLDAALGRGRPEPRQARQRLPVAGSGEAAEAMTLPQCAQSGGAQPWSRP